MQEQCSYQPPPITHALWVERGRTCASSAINDSILFELMKNPNSSDCIYRMKQVLFPIWFLAMLRMSVSLQAATPSFSLEGNRLTVSAENRTYEQILELFKQKTGLEYEIPAEMKSLRLPLVEIGGLTVKAGLLKILEGSNYDYILVSAPQDSAMVSILLVTGKSSKISAAGLGSPSAMTQRMNVQPLEDPFGGGSEDLDDAELIPDPAANNPAQTENPPAQGAAPAQPTNPPPGVFPNQPNPNQPLQPGTAFPQMQPGQPQQLQPFPGNNNPNSQRSPY